MRIIPGPSHQMSKMGTEQHLPLAVPRDYGAHPRDQPGMSWHAEASGPGLEHEAW